MNKINIKDIFIDLDLLSILDGLKDSNNLYIDIDGNIYFEKEFSSKAIVFRCENIEVNNDIKELASSLFKEYQPKVYGTNCKIKPLNNWQNIIELNKNDMLYYDHQSDGVEVFEDETMENYGWHASALEINYREITDFIENNCEGTLVFYDNEIQFNGFCIIDNIEDARSSVKEFIKNTAKENIEKNILELDDDDVIEALEFFEIEGEK